MMETANQLLALPATGILLTVACYLLGVALFRRFRWSILQPLIVAVTLLIALLSGLGLDYEAYAVGGDIIRTFLGPLTVCLAVPLYQNLKTVKRDLLPILVSTTVGTVTSVGLVLVLGKVAGLDEQALTSLLPRGVTLPVALTVSQQYGGVAALTVVGVMVTALLGALLAPLFFRLGKGVHDDVAAGLAMGTCAHAIGTSKALERSSLCGSMSSIAMAIAAVVTALLMPFAITWV